MSLIQTSCLKLSSLQFVMEFKASRFQTVALKLHASLLRLIRNSSQLLLTKTDHSNRAGFIKSKGKLNLKDRNLTKLATHLRTEY